MSPLSAGPAAGVRLGERLVGAGLVSPKEVEAAVRAQRLVRGRLGFHLVRLGSVTASDLSDFLEREIAEGRLAPPEPAVETAAHEALPARLAHLYNIYPLGLDGNRLEIGVPPLCGQHVVDVVAEATGLLLEPRVMPARLLREAVERDYLGSAQEAVLEATCGLSTLVVEDELRGLRPLAPDLRDASLSAETWLRSALAEAMARRTRSVELELLAGGARLAIGGEAVPLPPARAIPPELPDLLLRLARLRPPAPGEERVGRFQVAVRGRRLVALVRAWGTPSGPRFGIALADWKLAADDLDEACEGLLDVQDAIETFAGRAGGGALIVAGPAGGGARRLQELLASRLCEALTPAVVVADAGAVAAAGAAAVSATTDADVARAIQRATEEGAALVVVDELPGTRAVERALLCGGRTRVVAGFAAPDAAATLAWLARHGFGGALKAGLLRGVLDVVAVDAACRCAAPFGVPAELLAAWHVERSPRGVVANAGCPECLLAAQVRALPVLAYTPVAGRGGDEILVDDERAARGRAHAAGGGTLLALALRKASGGGGEASSLLRLLA